LHCLGWGQACSVFIDPVKGEIIDQPWATVALWDAAQGGDSKIWKMLDRFEWQDGPERLCVKFCHLVADKVHMGFGRLVGATGDPFL
jgi:hypothetical protein